MFKKFRKTKLIIGATGVAALALLPISMVAKSAITPASFPSPAATAPVQPRGISETLTKADPKKVTTPDFVIKTDALSASNFASREAASKLLQVTPGVLDKYIPGDKDVFLKDSSDALKAAGSSALGGAYSGASDPDIIKFYGDASKVKLYKDLNPGMDKHENIGTRFDYLVPNHVMQLTDLNAAADGLDETPLTVDSSHPFTYKIGTIDTTQIKENQSLALNYIYQDGTSSRKEELIVPYSEDLANLADDSVTIQKLVDEKDIFFRTMNQKDRSTSPDITSNIDFNNSGLTLVKDDVDGEIAIYSSLQSLDAKSAIMVSSDSTKEVQSAATVGILASDTQIGGIDMKVKDNLPANKVSTFREFTYENNWKTVNGYSWADNSQTDVEEIVMYMKEGTAINNVPITFDLASTKLTFALDAATSPLVVSPNKGISVESYSADDKTFEVTSQYDQADGWFKVSIDVEKGANNPFLINANDGKFELAWTMPAKTQKQAPIFFEDPAPSTNVWKGGQRSTVKLVRKINDDMVSKEVYRDVYGSWLDTPSSANKLVTPGKIATLKNSFKDKDFSKSVIWKDFTYLMPNAKSIDFSDETATQKSLAEDGETLSKLTMIDVINKLNDYHNALIEIEKNNNIDIEDHNGKDSYKPTEIDDFDSFYQDYLKDAAGSDLIDKIANQIKNADKVQSVAYDAYMDDLKLWKEDGHKGYTALYGETGPSVDDKVNFFELQKAINDDEEFNRLIDTIRPQDLVNDVDSKDPDKSFVKTGNITIAEFVQDEIETIIPNLFKKEYSSFMLKMSNIKGKRFATFLKSTLDPKDNVKVLKPDTVTSGVSKVSGIQFSDVKSNLTEADYVTPKTGEELIKDLTQLIYKTGFYKSIFVKDQRLKDLFLKMYDSKTNDSDLWKPEAFDFTDTKDIQKDQIVAGASNIQNMLDVINVMLEKTKNLDGTFDDFNKSLTTVASATDKDAYIKNIENVAIKQTNKFEATTKDVLFTWTAGNEYTGTSLQKQVMLSNIDNVVQFLRTNDKAKILGPKLDEFIARFTSNEGSATSIAQLAPALGYYKLSTFIPDFSTDTEQTEVIVEKMVHVDPIRVLIPNTGQSKAFKAMEDKGGAATLGLVTAAGVLVFLLGGTLIGLSFTKRLVVGGKTWSIKMVIIRVALLMIALAGLYMVLTGTVLPGHEDLTKLVNV